jgi:hypothetical protein
VPVNGGLDLDAARRRGAATCQAILDEAVTLVG